MKFYQRNYSGETDKAAMIDLAHILPAANLHFVDLPYRLSSWALDDPGNVGLWFDENRQLVGWAVLQTPFWTVDYVCHPSAERRLHPEILAWTDRRAREMITTSYGLPAWYINVFSGQTDRIRDLEEAGYECQADVGDDSWSKVLLRRSVQAPGKIYSPPAGFVVRPLAGECEVEAYVELHCSVFESRNMTVEWRSRILEQPAYRRELDIVVVSPDGRLAAFCIGWLDEAVSNGQVEPLGCHKDFRRFALGRVALSEVLRRLQSLGAKDIFVETDSYRNTAFRLYESFDFQGIREILVYRKDYENTPT